MNPRVAVAHPGLVAGGGSEACTLWTVQALQDDNRVTLITTGRPDLRELNRKYGTDIDPAKVETRLVGVPPGTRKRFDALRGTWLARYCRRHARDFDVMISAYNVMDFGVAGIQMIADFSFDDDLRRELDGEGGAAKGALYRASIGRSLYIRFARALSGTSGDGWKRNLTASDSEWTRSLLRLRFGVDSVVVYPPVAGPAPMVPWEDREDGFVVMGRLVPEKGIGLIVAILSRVRKQRPVHLHIIGRRGRAAYAREIEELCRRNSDWVHLESELYGREKEALLAGHRFGISGCRNEAFGIAVADMVKAGAVVWVPDGGGQTEIVAHPGLIYSGPDHAAALILAALDDPDLVAGLRQHLETRADMFSSGRFVGEIRALVRDFLKDGHVARP
jgi:glycosyltransferase involved in cell wall biosynthesis